MPIHPNPIALLRDHIPFKFCFASQKPSDNMFDICFASFAGLWSWTALEIRFLPLRPRGGAETKESATTS